MILQSWSIALITCSLVTIVFGVVGAATALQVVRRWDIGSDSERQIRLEEQVWLAATLVQFGLVVQMISALIFIYAADYFATVLKGAMCAAGSLTANVYGLPALSFKLLTIFLAGLWIVLHRLDISSENFPLTRLKSFWLLLLLPFLAADGLFVLLYLVNLEPEIITSCCGIIFAGGLSGGYSLFDMSSSTALLVMLGTGMLLIGLSSFVLLRGARRSRSIGLLWGFVAAGSWICFYLLSLVAITVLVSPYVYALPHHRCPFDLLQYPYLVIGLPLYLFLHGAVFAGLGGAAAWIVSCRVDADLRADTFICRSILLSLTLLFLFMATAAWRPFSYMFFGGQ